MAEINLGAATRAPGKSNHIRREGKIPAVVYGRTSSPKTVAVDRRELQQALDRGANRLIALTLEGQTTNVMVKEVQRHPLRGSILHVDFHAVALDEVINVRVPVSVHGEESVAAGGGIVQHQLREVEVSCLPGSVPGHLEVDITGLHVGEHVSAGDIVLPAGVSLVSEADEIVVTVVAPRAAEEAKPEAEEEEPAAGEQPK